MISDEEKPISQPELRKWNHPILVSVIIFACVIQGIIFAVNLAEFQIKENFRKTVIQLNELSDKTPLKLETNENLQETNQIHVHIRRSSACLREHSLFSDSI